MLCAADEFEKIPFTVDAYLKAKSDALQERVRDSWAICREYIQTVCTIEFVHFHHFVVYDRFVNLPVIQRVNVPLESINVLIVIRVVRSRLCANIGSADFVKRIWTVDSFTNTITINCRRVITLVRSGNVKIETVCFCIYGLKNSQKSVRGTKGDSAKLDPNVLINTFAESFVIII